MVTFAQSDKRRLDQSTPQSTYKSDFKNYATGKGLYSADGDFEVWKRVVIEGYSKSKGVFYGYWLKENAKAFLKGDQVRFDDRQSGLDVSSIH